VHPGQALGEICHMDANGYSWALVFNRANEHSGFVNRNNLMHRNPTPHCANVGVEATVQETNPLFQCPGEHCNQGKATKGDRVRVECYVPGHPGRIYIWMYNLNNDHEGFYPDVQTYGLQPCRV
jgi:hypothetical protein